MEPPPDCGIGVQPPNEDAAGLPAGEPAAKKPRLEEQEGPASGGGEGMDQWIQSLNNAAAAEAAPPAAALAASVAAPAAAPDDGDDVKRPYQEAAMHLHDDPKHERSPSGSVASLEDNEEDVISARNMVQPGRQRDSSISRRNVSNPFLKSTTKLLESVTDLSQVLSHDDCMLLGRYFWVFTLEQLDFLLSDTVEEDCGIDEIVAKTARLEFTDRLRKLLLGERPGQKFMYTRADDVFGTHRYGIDPESIASAALIPPVDEDEGLRKDIRANVSSKSFPWLDSGSSSAAPAAMASPMDGTMPLPLTTPNMYSPPADNGTPTQAMDFQLGGYSTGPVATADEAAAGTQLSGPNDALMCVEDMATKAEYPEVLPDAEAEANRTATGDEAAKPAAEEPVKIEDTLTRWRDAIQEYKTNGSSFADSKKFKLDGAIGVLIPGSTMNFLRSVEAETVWDFLAARRQENAPIGKLVREWRRSCGATEVVTQYAISKHLSGVALRIENALSAVPPIELKSREWMSDPINGMAGAAREFLIYDQGIRSLAEFLSLKTKNLSIALENWRDSQGMERLKGSGKVAMVSSWKAQSREMCELERYSGKVVDMSEYLEEYEYKEKALKGQSGGSSSVKKRKSYAVRTEPKPLPADDPLVSTTILEETLGKEMADALKAKEIITPEDFLRADYQSETSNLYQALVDGALVQADLFESTIKDQRDSVSQAVKSSNGFSTLNPDRAHSSFTRNVKKRRSTDPFDALSATSQAFLETVGVNSAEQFLSTRSTELALKFAEWREEQGKPALKGCGSIASISGWKNLVRKRAGDLGLSELQDLEPERAHKKTPEPKSEKGEKAPPTQRRPVVRRKPRKKYVEPEEIEDEEVSEGADDSSRGGVEFENSKVEEQVSLRPKRSSKKAADVVVSVANEFLDKHKGTPLTDLADKKLVPDGLELFAVDSQILSGQFLFEISLRGASNATSLNLMFNGFNACEVNFDSVSSFVTCRLDGLGDQDQQFEVLADVPVILPKSSDNEFSAPFSTLTLGGGLLDVSRFVDRESFLSQDLAPFLDVLLNFGQNGEFAGWPETLPETLDQNVIIQRTKGNASRALLYLHQPIERGQTVSIRLPTLATLMSSKTYEGSRFERYHLIDDSLLSLRCADLLELGNWLAEKSLTSLQRCLNPTSAVDFEKACEECMRFAWMGHRTGALISQYVTTVEKDELVSTLLFARSVQALRSPEFLRLSPAQQSGYQTALVNAVKAQIQYGLDLDEEMGFVRRKQWSSQALALVDDVLDCFAKLVVNSGETAALGDLVNEITMKYIGRFSGETPSREFLIGLAVSPTCSWMGVGKGARKCVNPAVGSSEGGHIVCQKEGPAGKTKIVMSSIDAVAEGKELYSVQWYKQYVADITCQLLDTFGVLSSDFGIELDAQCAKAKEIVTKSASMDIGDVYSIGIAFDKFALILPKSQVSIVPNSLPFFLALVWPHLRNLGWSMVAGKTPSEIIYSSREHDHTRIGFEQHLREKQREKLKKGVNRIGFGKIDKSTKRLVAKVFVEAEKSSFDAVSTSTVKEVFDKYGEWLKSLPRVEGTKVDEHNGKIERTVRAVDNLFEAVAPLVAGRSNRKPPPGAGGRLSEAYPGSFLSDFLLVAPNVIRQANLPHKSQNESLAVVYELTKYFVAHHHDFLAESCHLPVESYKREPSFESHQFIGTRVIAMLQREAIKKCSTDGATEGTIMLMPPGDRDGLTDFIICVIENAMPLRASTADAERKKGRIVAGSPGLVCKHCMGARWEGRYFFSSVESLTSSYTVMEKHYLKCSAVPKSVKDELAVARNKHASQRKDIPVGSQQAFYRSLWNRLTQSNGGGFSPGGGGGVLMSPEAAHRDNQDGGDETNSSGSDENAHDSFDDHVKLIEHVKETVVMHGTGGITEALKQYYGCLEYGGCVYMRSHVMPEHFSATWLLSKVVPKDYITNPIKKAFVG